MAKTTVRLESRLTEIAAQAEVRAAAIVSKTGIDVVAGAQARIQENRSVDTGNMLNSVAWEPEDALSGEVRVGAWYAIFVEGGSVHPERAYRTREGGLDVMDAYTIAPKPFFAPAVEDARAPFQAAVAQLYA